MKYLFVVFVAFLVLPSCKTANILMESKSEREANMVLDSNFFYDANYQYAIHINDKISISVWGEDELSVGSIYGVYNSNEVYGKWLMVDANGNIEIPKLGTVNVLNMTQLQLKNYMKQRLSLWLKDPIVDIKILNREITILGEVRDPQVITVDTDNNTLLKMITICKGFEFYANIKFIKVLRQDGEHVSIANIDMSKSGNYLSKNIQLHPGDIVIVPSKKNKEFDKRVGNLIPFTTTVNAAAIILGLFN